MLQWGWLIQPCNATCGPARLQATGPNHTYQPRESSPGKRIDSYRRFAGDMFQGAPKLVASSATPNVDDISPMAYELKPISATLRNRLQKYHGFGQQKQKEGDFDYAHAMFGQCVTADPANIVYVESMLNNLFAKFRGSKRRPKVKANRVNFKKALAESNWLEVLKQGPEFLGQNPWDVATLRGLAQACAGLRQLDERFNDLELRYLRTALDGDPKNIEINKHCAESLARMGQFDQAIACWHRIEELSSGKAQAQKHISDLTVLKSMRANGMLDELPGSPTKTSAETRSTASSAPMAKKPELRSSATATAASDAATSETSNDAAITSEKTTVETLERAIVKSPENVENYLALAKLYEGKGEWQEVERVLRRALPVSGNAIRISERLENVQIRRARMQVATAEANAKRQPTEENRELVLRLKADLNRLELGIYTTRVQRYPDQHHFRYELAVCLKRSGNFKEAARCFAEAAEDAKLEPASRVQRGECLQQIRQYQEAMREYLAGAERASKEAKNASVQKLGLYRAGVLALGLKDHHQARKIFGQLVGLDPNYQDAKARLDKLQKMRDN